MLYMGGPGGYARAELRGVGGGYICVHIRKYRFFVLGGDYAAEIYFRSRKQGRSDFVAGTLDRAVALIPAPPLCAVNEQSGSCATLE